MVYIDGYRLELYFFRRLKLYWEWDFCYCREERCKDVSEESRRPYKWGYIPVFSESQRCILLYNCWRNCGSICCLFDTFSWFSRINIRGEGLLEFGVDGSVIAWSERCQQCSPGRPRHDKGESTLTVNSNIKDRLFGKTISDQALN